MTMTMAIISTLSRSTETEMGKTPSLAIPPAALILIAWLRTALAAPNSALIKPRNRAAGTGRVASVHAAIQLKRGGLGLTASAMRGGSIDSLPAMFAVIHSNCTAR